MCLPTAIRLLEVACESSYSYEAVRGGCVPSYSYEAVRGGCVCLLTAHEMERVGT